MEIIQKGEELQMMVQEINDYDGYFSDLYCYDMDSIDDLLHGIEPSEILIMVGQDFNIHHDYFRFDGYGHLESLYQVEYYKELIDREEEIRELYKEYNEY